MLGTAAAYLDVILMTTGLLAAAYGFYSGVLPRWLKRRVGFQDLHDDVYAIKEHTVELKADHRETIEELQTLKHGQIAIAEAVDAEHDSVRVDDLRRAHFGTDNHADDFLRGGD